MGEIVTGKIETTKIKITVLKVHFWDECPLGLKAGDEFTYSITADYNP